MFCAAKYLRIPVQFPYMKSTENLKKKMYIRDIKEQNFENSYIRSSRRCGYVSILLSFGFFPCNGVYTLNLTDTVAVYTFLLSRLNIGYFSSSLQLHLHLQQLNCGAMDTIMRIKLINTLYSFHFVQILGITSIHLASLHHIKLIIYIYDKMI